MELKFKRRGFFSALSAIVMLLLIASCVNGDRNSLAPSPSSWSTAELIGPSDSGNAESPTIAFDNAGNAIAIWSQEDVYNHEDPVPQSYIRANYFDGAVWGKAELIGPDRNDHPGNAMSPLIVFDDSGNATAIWSQDDSSRTNIWANYFDGISWGTAEIIAADDNTWYPRIALDTAGNAFASWSKDDGTSSIIQANYFNGKAWSMAELIATDDIGSFHSLQIATDDAGDAIVVWSQDDGTSISIWANYSVGTTWSRAELIGTDDTADFHYPLIAVDAASSPILVWQQHDGARYNIWANYFDGTAWGTAELIGTANADDAGNALFPQVAVDAAGNAIAVWQQHDGTRYNIWANYFDGTAWGTAEQIGADNAGNAVCPQVAVDTAGNAIAVWYQGGPTSYNIWANYFNGTVWGTAELIGTANADDARQPQIAFDAAGNAIAVWQQYDGTRYTIWANYFKGE